MCFKVLLIVFGWLSLEVNFTISSSTTKTCERTLINDNNFGVILRWGETPVNESRPSSPYCVDSAGKTLERRCLESGFWGEFEPKKCAFYSLEKYSDCPIGSDKLKLISGDKSSSEDEVESDEVCIYATVPKKFNNECLKFGESKSLLEFSSSEIVTILEFIKFRKNILEFWLPLKRMQNFEPFKMQTLGDKWSLTFEVNQLQDNYVDKCMKFQSNDTIKNNWILKSENCKKEIPEICIKELRNSQMLQMGCKVGFTSEFADYQDNCYSVEKVSTLPTRKLFDATKIKSLKFLRDLISSSDVLGSDDKCLVDFGLSSKEIFNSTYGNYTVVDKSGKWFIDDTFTCAIFEEKIDLKTPKLDLRFHAPERRLLLIIYSEESLWKFASDYFGVKCFTISSNDFSSPVKIRKKVWRGAMSFFGTSEPTNVINTKTIYELKLQGSGSGVYWCEGHMMKTLKLIKSNRIVAKRDLDSVSYAVSLETKVPSINAPFYTKKSLDVLSERLKSNLLSSTSFLSHHEQFIVKKIEKIAIMRIINFYEFTSRVTSIYHITISSKLEDRTVESDEEYEEFMEKYADKFNDNKFTLNSLIIKHLEEIFMKLSGEEFYFNWIHSTEQCLTTFISKPNANMNQLSWDETIIGQRMPPRELCLLNTGIPLTRKCEGNFIVGGVWESLSDERLQCVDKSLLSSHTKVLHSLNENLVNETRIAIENMTSISSHFDQLIPADLFYISKAIRDLASSQNVSSYDNFDLDDRFNLTIILNNVMNVNEKFIQLSQLKLNTTNILLDSYDNLINSLLTTNYSIYNTLSHNNYINNIIKKSSNHTDGTLIIQTEKIIVFFCDPAQMNVSGLALVRKINSNISNAINETLLDFDIQKLYAHQTPDDILSIYQDSLEIASFFPQDLLNQINLSNQQQAANNTNSTSSTLVPLKIAIKVFYDDKMFRENVEVTHLKAQSKIISVSMPGQSQDLPLLLPIMFRKSKMSTSEDGDGANVCGYWDFQPNGTSSDSSEWLQTGCELTGASKFNSDIVLCGCSHMTHFAYLVTGTYIHDINLKGDVIVTQYNLHSQALNTITLLGGALSIVGIIGIFVTAICFKTWREKASSKVLLQLSLAILLQMILFSFFSTERHRYTIDTQIEKNICIILGSSLHYSVLVTFSWMLITAFLQFKRYVIVLGSLKPERFFLKAFFIGWGSPLLPIIAVLAANPQLYIPEIFGICYPQGLAFYLSVLLPVGLIVIANLVIFIMVIRNILKTGAKNMRKTESSLILSQVRVSIFLFFLLGLTWIFGFLATSSRAIVFSYLFCLTATIQGFVLFIYFIVMDPITRKLWRESFRNWKQARQ